MDVIPLFSSSLSREPHEVVTQLAILIRDGYVQNFGTFSIAIYDTAWVSMVHRIIDGQVFWLFEDCFDYILDQQGDDGVWQTSTISIDGILNTSAGLLSLLTHVHLMDPQNTRFNQLQLRINKAEKGLRILLEQWDVGTTNAVGFEVLVPSLLQQIAHLGVHIEYPGRKQLQKLYEKKMKKFRPELVYRNKLTTLHHSLEGLVGMIDFDKVRHHCSSTLGMLGSPASTSAYLIHSSGWDDRAESYLRQTLTVYGGRAVPSAFPTYLFEVSWALSTMLDPSISTNSIATDDVEVFSSFFTQLLDNQQGVVGFAAGALEDADDTARVLLALKRLSKPYDTNSMISKFESEDCFRTYEIESNPSFSANCNVVMTLLEHDLTARSTRQIEKILVFLLDRWDGGTADDKWNISPFYVFMLFAEVLVQVLKRYNKGELDAISEQLVLHRVPSVICRLLSQIILRQTDDGSWDSSLQVTSYAVIAIAKCLALPWSSQVEAILAAALKRGRCFVTASGQLTKDSEHLWIEKVTYTSGILQSIYCIAALHVQAIPQTWNSAVTAAFIVPDKFTQKMRALFSRLPFFREKPGVCIELALVEAMSLSNSLHLSRLMVFPRDQMAVTSDKYLEFIPVLWIAANQVSDNVLPPNLIWEMVLQSMFIYQVDEYMESVVAKLSRAELLSLDLYLQKSCNAISSTTCQSLTSETQNTSSRDDKSDPTPPASPSQLMLVQTTLMAYVDHICNHPAVQMLSDIARNELTLEVYNFMHAHIMQNVLNRQLKSQSSFSLTLDEERPVMPKPHVDYAAWVRTLGANTTSCPMAFCLFTTLINYYTTAPQRLHPNQRSVINYCLEVLSRHLAIMCRQYNDIGSATRDREEGNLNSLDFTLFDTGSNSNDEEDDDIDQYFCKSPSLDESKKDQLMQMANIERSCMELMISKLRNLFPKDHAFMKQIQVFIDVTDLFGQIYIVKDFSSRVQRGK